jgi:ComEC/Rec2-related protein
MNRFTFSWERFPALFILASLISGALLSKALYLPLLFACTHQKQSFKIGYVALALTTFLLFKTDHNLAPEDSLVAAYVKPVEIKESNNRMFMIAKIPYLKTENGDEYRKMSAIIPLSKYKRPMMNSHYIIKGKLKKSSGGYTLSPNTWDRVENTLSFAENRYFLKQKARKIISAHTVDEDLRVYFSALVTGCIDDPCLKQSFFSAGMLHTLAISGFHFSWIIFILSVPLTLILPKKHATILLLFFALLYFLFLGQGASISRAWLSISIFLITLLLSKVPIPLNALGVAGIISILIDPYLVYELAFSLSYLATFAILTLRSFISELTNYFCKKRDKKILMMMPFLDKCAYYPLRFFLHSFLFSLLIQIALLPILIHQFTFFPLWGLFFNGFFPISMIPTLILLLFAFALHPIFGSALIWKINEAFSKPFLEAIIYGKGVSPLLIKLPTINPQLLSLFGCALIFFCFSREKIAHEEHLISLDDSS